MIGVLFVENGGLELIGLVNFRVLIMFLLFEGMKGFLTREVYLYDVLWRSYYWLNYGFALWEALPDNGGGDRREIVFVASSAYIR